MPVLAGQTGVSAWRGHTVSDRFDSIEESERVWLDAKRRSAARRSWLLIGALVLVAVFLAWLTVDGLGGGQAVTTTTTVDQRALADGQQALTDWGRFAVTNDLRVLKDSFWANGPQYKLLAKEAQSRRPSPGTSGCGATTPPAGAGASGRYGRRRRADGRLGQLPETGGSSTTSPG